MPTGPDIFVGSVALILGTVFLLAALLNYEAAYQLPKAQAIENRFGRRGARIFYALLGIVLLGLGGAIMAGFAPNVDREGRQSGRLPATGLRATSAGKMATASGQPTRLDQARPMD